MSACPNKNSQEWKDLVAVMSEADAMTAFALNNNSIPSLAEANRLMKSLKQTDIDEQISSASDEFKLKRAVEQRVILERSKLGANKAQVQTIDRLIQMNQEYQDFLKTNIENAKNGIPTEQTLSVSKFIGSTEFNGPQKDYEAFKLFGTFMHEILEVAQLKAIEQDKNIALIMTEEFFDEYYEKYLEKYPFEIEDLSKETMFRQAKAIVDIVNVHNYSGFKIIPEVTITGTSKSGSKIIGRLDLVLVDNVGKIHILDFKTKKVKSLMQQNLAGQQVENLDLALVNMALSEHPISRKPGTAESFYSIEKRSAYITWMLQLDTYENMLKQNGFDVGDKSIISLIYQTDDDHKKFKGSVVHVFTDQEYYAQAANVKLNTDGFWFKDEEAVRRIVEPAKRAVRIEVPVKGEEVQEEYESKKAEETFAFTPEEKQMKKFVTILEQIVNSQLEEARQKREDLRQRTEDKKNKDLDDVLSEKIRALKNFEAIVQKLKTSNPSALLYSSNFFATLDTVAEEISKYTESASNVIQTFRDNQKSDNKILETITTAFSKSQAASQIISLMQEIVNEASENPDNNITEDSPVRKKLAQMQADSEKIKSYFREIAVDSIVKDFLMKPGDKVYARVNEQLRQALTVQLESNKLELEKFRAGLGKLGIWNRLKGATLSMLDKEYKEKLKSQTTPDGAITLDRIERLEKDNKRIELILQGYQFDEQALENYLTGITNPDSLIYMGAQNIFNTDSLLKGWAFDKIIASASNSDLGISVFTTALKDWEAQARFNVMNDLGMIKFDRLRQELINNGMSIEEINDLVSEWRTVEYIDQSGEVQSKRVLNMVKPYSEQYEQTYRRYNQQMKILNREVYRLQSEYYEAFGTPEAQSKKDEYLAKVAERNKHNDEYIEWLVDNANTPYVEAFYKLQKAIPADIRDELQKLYMEQQIILHEISRGEEVLLDDADYDRIQEIDIEIKKLRDKAKEQNPEYADYIDQFNELFEYDTNENYFKVQEKNAIVRYGDDPKRLEKWYLDNQVTRPKAEWYNALAELYERRSQYYSSDPRIAELLDEKNKLMRPYKVGGRFNPKYLSHEDILELDRIESEIEQLIEELKESKTSPLTKDEKRAVREISEEIKRLVSFELNPAYKREFDDRYQALTSAYKLMDQAQTEYNQSKVDGDKTAIEEAEAKANQMIQQFFQVEKEFMNWYNKTHMGTYKVGDLMKGVDVRMNKVPKSFNFERLPGASVRDEYMEKVPNPKYYKIKRLRIGNWTLDGVKLTNKEIKELQQDPDKVSELESQGRLVTAPGAYNPNFISGPGGIPMPKEVMMDPEGHYTVDPNAVITGNINEKYMKILGNPKVAEFYHAMADLFFDLQKKSEGRKVGYQIPGFASSTVENMARDGVSKALQKQWRIFLDKNIKGIGESESKQDIVENAFGDLGSRLRMRYSDQLEEGLQSEDAVGAIMKWATEAHFNIAMQEVAPKSEAFVEFLKMQRGELEKRISAGQSVVLDSDGRKVDMAARLKEINNTIDILEYEQRKFLSGQYDEASNRSVKKAMNAIFAYTAFIRIGFDVANQTKNLISGNVQSWIAAGGQDSDHYTRKNWLWAKGKVYGYNGFLSNYMKDWGKITDLTVDTMMYRFYNPLQKETLKYYSDVSGGRKRKFSEKLTNVGELGFIMQDKGDTEIGTTVMYAVMDKYRYKQIESIDPTTGEKIYKKDSEGNDVLVPAHQAYFINSNGQLQRRKDVEFTEQDEAMIRNIIYSEVRRAQGNYAKSDQTYAEQSPVGKAAFFFRKFLVPGILNRFGYLRPNWEGSEVAMGYWRAVGRAMKYFGPKATLKEFLIGSKTLEKMGSTGLRTYITRDIKGQETGRVDVGDFYVRKVHQARRDAVMMLLLASLSFMALAYVKRKDDDDEELGMLEGNAIRVLWGVNMETTSLFPVGAGSTEYVKNFTTAIPLVREMTALIKTGNHAYALGMAYIMNGAEEPDPGYDSAYYQEVWKDAFYTRKSGAYEKGDAKLMKDFADLTGIKNFRDLFDPNYRIDVLKRNQ